MRGQVARSEASIASFIKYSSQLGLLAINNPLFILTNSACLWNFSTKIFMLRLYLSINPEPTCGEQNLTSRRVNPYPVLPSYGPRPLEKSAPAAINSKQYTPRSQNQKNSRDKPTHGLPLKIPSTHSSSDFTAGMRKVAYHPP